MENHREYQREYQRLWRKRNAEKVKEIDHRNYVKRFQRPAVVEAKKVQVLAWRAAHREQVLANQARWRLRRKSVAIIRHHPDQVYRLVSRAVSSGLPRFVRDDVMSSMILAVLEGKLLLENVASSAKSYLARHNREYDSFKTLSLDAPMGGADLRRIDLLEAPAAFEPEEEDDGD
ncbi:hypothetical protein NKH85_16240 [Mesorhizobium sp. M0924]|uniref:hypothetical protein n=1 Tax=unclassified Mesorhizobium TaxID=325217 RepID=UPI00333B3D5F